MIDHEVCGILAISEKVKVVHTGISSYPGFRAKLVASVAVTAKAVLVLQAWRCDEPRKGLL